MSLTLAGRAAAALGILPQIPAELEYNGRALLLAYEDERLDGLKVVRFDPQAKTLIAVVESEGEFRLMVDLSSRQATRDALLRCREITFARPLVVFGEHGVRGGIADVEVIERKT